MGHTSTASRSIVLLSLALLLAACEKSPQNAVAPAPTTAVAAATARAPVAASAPVPTTAPPASSAPAATTAASAGTSAAPAAASDTGPEIAGSVAVAQGSVSDTAQDGSVRQLKDGDDVYPGDSFVVGPDSYLDLDLEDTGRMLLRPNTSFQITRYHFEPAAHDPNAATDANGQPLIKPQQPESAFFRLIKGGLRAVDGLIGHSTPQNYGVETPVATIGVRGTAFDVRYCGDDCADEADASGKPDNGLYTSVSEGSVGIKNDSGETVTQAGQSGFVKSRREKAQALATPPKALRHMDLPEKLKARAAQNRSHIRQRRQQRRQRILERRRAAAQRPAAATPAKSIQERRQERREEQRGAAQRQQPAGKGTRMQQREERREQRQQKQTAAPGQPAAAPPAPAQGRGLTARERRQQLRQERQQQRQQKQQDQGAAAQPPAKAAQPATGQQGEARCKGKRKKDKDKDKCGGG